MESISIVSRSLRVDTHLAKFTQACVVTLTALAFILQWPVLTLITMLCMAISVLAPAASPFRLLYRGIAVPLHLLQPRIVEDDPAPHRFAQGVGTVFLLACTLVLFFTHATVLGWTLDLIVFEARGDAVAITEIDAPAQPELSTRYQILTVPSTVVLDANGKAQAINYGLANTQKLLTQIDALLLPAGAKG